MKFSSKLYTIQVLLEFPLNIFAYELLSMVLVVSHLGENLISYYSILILKQKKILGAKGET